MNHKLQQIFKQLAPFLILGISIAISLGLFILFFYVILWGILIGGCLWLIVFIKNTLFSNGTSPINQPHQKSTKGRVIEHDDVE